MRIKVPLDGLSLQLERIIACVAAELVATHQHPSGQTKFVKRVAKKLIAILACYLAGEVASTLSLVAAIEHREMVAPLYQPLLTPVFWVRPIYTELLHAASRLKKDTRIETARPSNGLVKIMCSPKALGEEPFNATAANRGLTHWIGSASHVQALYVWVPAHWAPCVCSVVKARTQQFDARRDHEQQALRAWFHLPPQQPQRDGAGIDNATTHEGVAFFLRAGTSVNAVYQGLLNGVIRQMPIAAWFNAQCKRIQLTISCCPQMIPWTSGKRCSCVAPAPGLSDCHKKYQPYALQTNQHSFACGKEDSPSIF